MKKRGNSLCVKIILVVLGCCFLYPLVWMFLMSFKEKAEVTVNPFGLPKIWDMGNYKAAIEAFDYIRAFGNSVAYTIGTCVVTIILASMVAYAIARTRYRFAKQTLLLFTMGLVVPVNVVMIPLYNMILDLGLKGSVWSMILPYSAFQLPASVLMFYAFLRGIPVELEEAADLDGCNLFKKFFYVIVPCIKPAISTRFVLIFLNIWNEFTLALVLANKTEMRPLPIALQSFFVSNTGTPDWGVIGAAMMLTSIPSILIYAFGNKGIENALTASSGLK